MTPEEYNKRIADALHGYLNGSKPRDGTDQSPPKDPFQPGDGVSVNKPQIDNPFTGEKISPADPNHERDGFVRGKTDEGAYKVVFEPGERDGLYSPGELKPNGRKVEPERLPKEVM